ncbi:MAG: DUF3047 domain-containing protein [Comamonadaceae bacterium]|nr:DUF3047 domain-containing protein [Comamonadaceae bacterium]
MRRLPHAVLACATGLLLLMGILLVAAEDRIRIAAFSEATGSKLPSPWRVVGLPGSSKPFTRFDLVPLDDQTVLRVLADHSYANLVHDLPDVVVTRGIQLRWRWRLDQPLPDADLRRRETDDTALKVCLLFNAPAENLGALEQGLLGVARAISGEKLPAATLCYVWDHTLPVGTLLDNAFTSRIRMIVVDSGTKALGQWVSHQRDVTADFNRAFGREFPTLPPLEGVAVGADADNTGGHSVGFVGDVTLSP